MSTSVYVRWVWIVGTSALVLGLSVLVVVLAHAVMVTSAALDRALVCDPARIVAPLGRDLPHRDVATDSGWSAAEERALRGQVQDAIRVRDGR